MLTRRAMLASVSAAALTAWLAPGEALAASDPWAGADPILKRIRPPSIPGRDFPITRYGAKPGLDASAAIRAAIDAAAGAGGGRVVVPAGDWLTGPIHLRSRIELHVAKGATLKFLTDPAAYLPMVHTRFEGLELMNYSPFLYAFGQEDIAITGEGTLDGQADWSNWWGWIRQKPASGVSDRRRLEDMADANVPVGQRQFGPVGKLRPNFIQPYRCRNVLIEGVTIVASPMWEVHPVECENVIVRGLTIRSHGPNNDGCDPESCRDVLIEDCFFDTGDDCIAIKSGRNSDGRRVNRPTENVIIRNCKMIDGHGGVTLGSEITGGVRNVFVEKCTMDSPELNIAIRFKNNAMRGGTLENVFVRDVTVGQVRGAVVSIDYNYGEGAKGPYKPVFRNLLIERLTAAKGVCALDLQGFANAPIEGVVLRDCAIDGVTQPSIVRFVKGLEFERVRINGVPAAAPPSINIDDPSLHRSMDGDATGKPK